MNQILIALTSLFVCVLISCNEKQKDTKIGGQRITAIHQYKQGSLPNDISYYEEQKEAAPSFDPS